MLEFEIFNSFFTNLFNTHHKVLSLTHYSSMEQFLVTIRGLNYSLFFSESNEVKLDHFQILLRGIGFLLLKYLDLDGFVQSLITVNL